jgi:hypothetical protein
MEHLFALLHLLVCGDDIFLCALFSLLLRCNNLGITSLVRGKATHE